MKTISNISLGEFMKLSNEECNECIINTDDNILKSISSVVNYYEVKLNLLEIKRNERDQKLNELLK